MTFDALLVVLLIPMGASRFWLCLYQTNQNYRYIQYGLQKWVIFCLPAATN